MKRANEIEKELIDNYGRLISISGLAEIFSYPTVAAARQAEYRGQLPVQTKKIVGRRDKVVAARVVAQALAKFEE